MRALRRFNGPLLGERRGEKGLRNFHWFHLRSTLFLSEWPCFCDWRMMEQCWKTLKWNVPRADRLQSDETTKAANKRRQKYLFSSASLHMTFWFQSVPYYIVNAISDDMVVEINHGKMLLFLQSACRKRRKWNGAIKCDALRSINIYDKTVNKRNTNRSIFKWRDWVWHIYMRQVIFEFDSTFYLRIATGHEMKVESSITREITTMLRLNPFIAINYYLHQDTAFIYGYLAG